MARKNLLFISFALFVSFHLFAQQKRGIVSDPKMEILPEDIFLSEKHGSSGERIGVDLFLRKKERVESIMLVETTKDPLGKEPNYSYRAMEFNEVNGNEKRYLDGKELVSKYAKYSLISSTVVNHEKLGKSYHIYIPNELLYGYPWSRNGTVTIGKGTFINIRTFEKKYGDYTGQYMDNPYMFDMTKIIKKPEIILTDDYNAIAANKFAEIANDGSGLIFYSKKKNLVNDLLQSLESINPKDKVDVVFAIDATGSMRDDLEFLKKYWIPKLLEQLNDFTDIRLGLLFYKDYKDNFSFNDLPVKLIEFTNSGRLFKEALDREKIRGNEGGDVPEAVYEALYASIEYYDWREDAVKKVILLGDAEPHEKPRGKKKIFKDDVIMLAKERNITIDCIILPDDK